MSDELTPKEDETVTKLNRLMNRSSFCVKLRHAFEKRASHEEVYALCHQAWHDGKLD